MKHSSANTGVLKHFWMCAKLGFTIMMRDNKLGADLGRCENNGSSMNVKKKKRVSVYFRENFGA